MCNIGICFIIDKFSSLKTTFYRILVILSYIWERIYHFKSYYVSSTQVFNYIIILLIHEIHN